MTSKKTLGMLLFILLAWTISADTPNAIAHESSGTVFYLGEDVSIILDTLGVSREPDVSTEDQYTSYSYDIFDRGYRFSGRFNSAKPDRGIYLVSIAFSQPSFSVLDGLTIWDSRTDVVARMMELNAEGILLGRYMGENDMVLSVDSDGVRIDFWFMFNADKQIRNIIVLMFD